ncbi:hypothetical protein BY996DRAFT_8392460 [Phakopsora pachyrhizi]|nr:hypothetical protein BY996DRAFT_8392460 [Phakopsora pachyrhizi]
MCVGKIDFVPENIWEATVQDIESTSAAERLRDKISGFDLWWIKGRFNLQKGFQKIFNLKLDSSDSKEFRKERRINRYISAKSLGLLPLKLSTFANVEQSPLIEAPPRSSNQILSLPNAEDLRSYENPPNFASSPIVENDAELLHIFGDNSILKNQLHPKDVEKNFEQRIKESFKLVYVKLRARRITADCFSPSITSRELLKIRRKIHKGKTKEIISVQKKFNEYDQVDAEIDLVALRIGLFIDNYKLDVNERIFGLSSMEFNPKMDEIIEFIKPKPRVTTRVFHAVSQISFKELEILENEIYLFKPKVSSELTEKNLFKAAIQSVNISVLVFARMISHLAGESLWNGNFLNVQYKLWDYLKKFWNCNSTFLSKDSNINFHSLNYLELLPNPKFDIRFILEDFNLDFLQRLDARRKLLCTWKILSLWLPISDKRFAVSKDEDQSKGIITISQKLNVTYPCYEQMDHIFGSLPNVKLLRGGDPKRHTWTLPQTTNESTDEDLFKLPKEVEDIREQEKIKPITNSDIITNDIPALPLATPNNTS